MKRLVVLIVLMSSLTLARQGTEQFTGRHGVVELPITIDRITVKPDFTQFEDWESILTSDESIDPTQDMRELWGGFFLIWLLDGADPQDVIAGLTARPDVAFAYPVFHNSQMEDIYMTNHVVVRFSEVLSEDQVDSIRTAFNFSLRTTLLDDSRYQVLQLPPHTLVSPIDIADEIHAADVQSNAHPSFILPFHLDFEPNDTYWSTQWYFKNTGQLGGTADADIDLDEAYDYTIAGTDTLLIAVLDNGIMDHPDFPNARIVSAWDYASGPPEWLGDADVEPTNLPPHGMAVSGIIAASTDNDTGLAGVVRHSDRLGIIMNKIFMDGPLGGNVPAWVVAKAIEEAVDSGAQIMSCSWSGDPDQPGAYAIYDALTYAHHEGTVVVFSAGNDTSAVNFPSYHPDVIAVGASDSCDNHLIYSNYGPQLDVVAPSASAEGHWGSFWILDRPDRYGQYSCCSQSCAGVDHDYNCSFCGTSASCPQVSGIVALILLRRPDLRSSWLDNHTGEVRDIIRYSSEREQYDVHDTSRVNDHYGWGRVNAARALLAVARGDADNNGVVNISDAIRIRDYIFSSGLPPAPTMGTGDADCNGLVNISDTVYLIAYIFGGGPAPPICFKYDY